MDGIALEKDVAAVRRYLRTRLGIGGGFARQMRRARRHLPSRLHGDLDVLEQAVQFAKNPKMARRIDEARVHEARRVIVGHLVDLDRRSGQAAWLGDVGATIGFNLAIIAAVTGLAVWMISR